MKLHRYIDHDWKMTAIDFQVTRSKVKELKKQLEALEEATAAKPQEKAPKETAAEAQDDSTAILSSHEGFEFVGKQVLHFQEVPLIEPTNFLRKEMLANGSDGLLFHVSYLPRVQVRTIFLCTLTTLAREVDTNQLRHILGEDVDSLHIRLVKEKHSHIANVAFGRIGNRRTTGLLQTLGCWGPLVVSPIRRRHGRITLGSLSTASILSSSVSSFIIEGWRANLHIIHRIDFVLVNAAPAEDDWGVGRLRRLRWR